MDQTFVFRTKGIVISALAMTMILGVCRLLIPLQGQGIGSFIRLLSVMIIGGGVFIGGLMGTRVIDKQSLKLLFKKGSK